MATDPVATRDFVDCFTADGVWHVQMRRSASGFGCRGYGEIRPSLATQASVRVPPLDGRWRFEERIAEIDDM
jgi:hypothetical protein